MRPGGRIARWQRSAWAIAVVAIGAIGCTDMRRAPVGASCGAHDDCIAGAQCFGGVCAPGCEVHADCGGGYLCEEAGVCEPIESEVGDACARELDCGPRQSCQLTAEPGGDDALLATCQPELSGAVTGAACEVDGDCRSGLCALGQCTELCQIDDDCPSRLACVTMPRVLEGTAPVFAGCLQREGSIELTFPMARPSDTLRIPVPSNARAFALVVQVDDPTQLVAATRVLEPDGDLLYQAPRTEDEFYANPIRYRPGREITTLLVPNAPEIPLRVGAYEIDVATTDPEGRPSASIPSVTVMYRLGGLGAELDLNLYFLDLDEHPCSKAFRGGLDAKTAPQAGPLRDEFLPELIDILGATGMRLGEVSFVDIHDRPDLDSLAREELPALLRQSTIPGGVDLFFVRSIDPPGVQALVSGTPGAPGIPGTAASGVALSVETLCYRPWKGLARTAAHAIARHLGLFRNVEPDGREDPIADSAPNTDNLMYFSEFGGTDLSLGQSEVLRQNPVVR